MNRRHWYLLAYDIADERRLKRVHKYLKKRGLAAQKSVFFIHFSQPELDRVLAGLRGIIHVQKDDVRVYPIEHPAQVWLSGAQPVQAEALLDPGRIGDRQPAGRNGKKPVATAADQNDATTQAGQRAQAIAVLPDWLQRLWRRD
jgi:CRISPR-associated endonuclease Cas2